MYVAVIGSADADEVQLAVAEECGRRLAEGGAVVVTGGRGGVMEAASRGAFEAGGQTLGILPGDDRREANRWVTVAVATGLGEARNALVVRASDAVIAVGGAWGTLSEIAFALGAGKVVVGLDTWRPVQGEQEVVGVRHVADPAAAVRAILAR